MILEFESRIAHLSDAVRDREMHNVNDNTTHKLRGALEECERLRAFYVQQMVGKGRIIPETELEVT